LDKKRVSETGIRVEIPQGTDEAVAVDELVDDFLHGDVRGALHALHEPHEAAGGPEAEAAL
jgi:predicted methyltransferase MtxX (methanogen marker protein 4)